MKKDPPVLPVLCALAGVAMIAAFALAPAEDRRPAEGAHAAPPPVQAMKI